MSCGDQDIRNVESIPDEKFGTVFSLENYTRSECILMNAQIVTGKKLKGLKHDNGGRLLKWLMDENVTLKVNMWKDQPAADIGFLAMSHPTMVWKSDLAEDIVRILKKRREEERKRQGRTQKAGKSGEEIPQFVLYHDRKSFGTGRERVHSTVTFVQCKKDEAKDLRVQLTRSQKELNNTLGIAFIPTGYHLSESPRAMLKVLNSHNRYTNEKQVVAIIGLPEEFMSGSRVVEGKEVEEKERMRKAIGAERIERTGRSKDLGKWLVLTDLKNLEEVRRQVDKQLDTIRDGKVIKEEDLIQDVGWPRRTDRSIEQREYEEGLSLIREVFSAEVDIEEEPVILESDMRTRKLWQERQDNKKKQKTTYAEAARKERPEDIAGNSKDIRSGMKQSTGRRGYEEEKEQHRSKSQETKRNKITQEEERIEEMEDIPAEEEMGRIVSDEKVEETLHELEAMRVENKAIVQQQEKNTKVLENLQKSLTGMRRIQEATLESVKDHKRAIPFLQSHMELVLSQMSGIGETVKRPENNEGIMMATLKILEGRERKSRRKEENSDTETTDDEL